MDQVWGGMILIGIIYGTVTGHLEEVSEAAIQSSKGGSESVCGDGGGYGTLGGDDADRREVRTSWRQWSKNAAGAELCFRKSPGITRRKSIATNLLANILGLGWAATPAGLSDGRTVGSGRRAAEKKQRAVAVGAASNEMCDFLILNISSLQLIRSISLLFGQNMAV